MTRRQDESWRLIERVTGSFNRSVHTLNAFMEAVVLKPLGVGALATVRSKGGSHADMVVVLASLAPGQDHPEVLALAALLLAEGVVEIVELP